jgi:dipeptidyl aminopeptidase/acylaminoacyl peptidase
MTTHGQRLDRMLPELIVELAGARTPDYLEAAIEEASSRPQRPAWTYPGRWIPMEITTKAAPAARMPWRQLGLLAVLGVLLAGVAVAYVGSQRTRPAPYFGLAANGTVAVERDGDIYAINHATGTETAISAGPEIDTAPVYTRDGTRIAFERADGGRRLIMVANADGSGIEQVTPEALAGIVQWSLSPDGREVLVAMVDNGKVELVALAADGSGELRPLGAQLLAGAAAIDGVGYRPPDGREILVGALLADEMHRGIYVIDAQSGATLRTVVEPPADADVADAYWSMTGDEIFYIQFAVAGDGPRFRRHVVSADGTDARLVDRSPGIAYDGGAAWSNDGTRFVRVLSDGVTERHEIVSGTGDAPPLEFTCDTADCPADLRIGNIAWTWAPDDSVLLGELTVEGGSTTYYLADPDTARITPLDWTGSGPLSWQRLAP